MAQMWVETCFICSKDLMMIIMMMIIIIIITINSHM